MRPATLIPCLALAGWVCAQQPGDPLDVRGVVVEPGSNLPVAGAQATLYEFVEDQTQTIVRTVRAAVTTDARGAFVFHAEHPGNYYLEVKKEGYFGLNYGGPGTGTASVAEMALTLQRGQPSRQTTFNLMRPGQLTGRLVDEDGKPIAGWPVAALTDKTQLDFQMFTAMTDVDGSFVISKLVPDRYLVRIAPKSGDSEAVVPNFTENDLKVVDRDVETSYWPGGPDLQLATPIPVGPGGSASVGTITVRKVPYYRAHVSVPAEDCKNRWQLSVVTATSRPHFIVVPCAKDFLIRNLRPGSYWFLLSNGLDGETNRQALAAVEITRGNVEVTLTMEPGIIVNGRVVGFEGASLPPSKGFVTLAQPVIAGLGSGIRPIQADAEGKFQLKNLAATRYQVNVKGLTGKSYVKEIRYNDIPAPDGIFTPGTNGRVDIVVDDQGATVTGSVTDGDKPANRSRVLLLDGALEIVKGASTDLNGKFQIPGIAPGEYRLLAIPQPGDLKIPDNLGRFTNILEKVALERGGSQNVVLKLTDTSR